MMVPWLLGLMVPVLTRALRMYTYQNSGGGGLTSSRPIAENFRLNVLNLFKNIKPEEDDNEATDLNAITTSAGSSVWLEKYSSGVGRASAPSITNTIDSLEALGLNISAELGNRSVIPYKLTATTALFCNRELNMQLIESIGFDMDYTLASYLPAFDLLAYDGAKDKLVKWLGYPAEVVNLQYAQDNCLRGCIIDTKKGNILKLDQHRYVRAVEHGLTPMSSAERKSVYRESYQEWESFSGPEFTNIDTPFSLVDACLFAQLVDLRDKQAASDSTSAGFWKDKTYRNLWSDMRKCIDRCHKDGVIKLTVAQDPKSYIGECIIDLL